LVTLATPPSSPSPTYWMSKNSRSFLPPSKYKQLHQLGPSTTHYNECYYIPVISLLLQDLLESLGTTSPHLLAIGLHTMMSSPTTQAPLEHFITRRMVRAHIAINNHCLL
jgi:hypothetical protein